MKTRNRRPIWAAVVALSTIIAACATNQVPSRLEASHIDDARAVREAREAQNRAIIAGDLPTIASYWTEDVSIRRALGGMINGRSAYLGLFAEEPGTVYVRHVMQVTVSDAWPLAFETGEWEGRTPGAAGAVAIRGRYSAQWVKRDGRWLIRGEVFVPLQCANIGCTWNAIP